MVILIVVEIKCHASSSKNIPMRFLRYAFGFSLFGGADVSEKHVEIYPFESTY